MDILRQVSLQEAIEERFSRKHIDKKIKDAIQADNTAMTRLHQGVALVKEWLAGDYYESKNKRLEQLKNMEIQELVLDLFVGVAYSIRPELFTAVVAKMAARLKFDEKLDAIKTTAELLAVLCQTDAFDIYKENQQASLMLVSRLNLPQKVVTFIEESAYLPPLVCEPMEVTHNFCSGYLTHNDSVILGSGNHHNGDLCLDVINKVNKVPLSLDPDFLDSMEETPKEPWVTQEQIDQWDAFIKHSKMIYGILIQAGNKFYFNHKVDKRGRLYNQGFHVHVQGTSYKKASLELANKEVVQGVPQGLQIL